MARRDAAPARPAACVEQRDHCGKGACVCRRSSSGPPASLSRVSPTCPANTVDIYPTLLELAGVTIENQPPLDGISLVPLIDGTMESRPKPMGFWVYPTRGIPVRSHEILLEMKKEQAGQAPAGSPHPRTPVSLLEAKHAPDDLQGHATWVDGDWKLHRIPQKKGGFAYELYHLVDDVAEQNDLSQQQPERVEAMKQALADWQASVVASLNGEDY